MPSSRYTSCTSRPFHKSNLGNYQVCTCIIVAVFCINYLIILRGWVSGSIWWCSRSTSEVATMSFIHNNQNSKMTRREVIELKIRADTNQWSQGVWRNRNSAQYTPITSFHWHSSSCGRLALRSSAANTGKRIYAMLLKTFALPQKGYH